MGVACPSAQLSNQHTGGWPGTHLLNLLLPRSAPTRTSERCGCTSSGVLECFFSMDPPQVLLLRRADGQKPPQVATMDLIFIHRGLLVYFLVDWTLLPLSAWWQAWGLSVAGNCYLSHKSDIFWHSYNGRSDQNFQIVEALQAIQYHEVNAIDFIWVGRSSRSVKGKSSNLKFSALLTTC